MLFIFLIRYSSPESRARGSDALLHQIRLQEDFSQRKGWNSAGTLWYLQSSTGKYIEHFELSAKLRTVNSYDVTTSLFIGGQNDSLLVQFIISRVQLLAAIILSASTAGIKMALHYGRDNNNVYKWNLYSWFQLHESLAKLVTENLHVKRWLFKMDNEFDGRGTG